MNQAPSTRIISLVLAVLSFNVILFEIILTRLFALVLFAPQAHLVISLALLGISIGGILVHLRPQIVSKEHPLDSIAVCLLLTAFGSIFAVWATLSFPLTIQSPVIPETLQDRSSQAINLVRNGWVFLMVPVLMIPFASAGVIFSSLFSLFKASAPTLYAADLAGGALGACALFALVKLAPLPDLIFLCASLLVLTAVYLLRFSESVTLRIISKAGLAAAVLPFLVSLFGRPIISVQQTAGYAEESIVHSEWTPLTRIAIFHSPKTNNELVVLDNMSASLIVKTVEQKRQMASYIARGLVYRISNPAGHVAIIGASAGPEVAAAEFYGFKDIEAIDIASEIFPLVAKRYHDSPGNPYIDPSVRNIKSDGRAAILHSSRPYDVIHMVHANLWSAAGVLSNAWSPSLLETKEAFLLYLNRISPDGTISFSRGTLTRALLPTIVAALKENGAANPWGHIILIEGNEHAILVKKRPWMKEERDGVAEILAKGSNGPKEMALDPFGDPSHRFVVDAPVMTDDRPYLDRIMPLAALFHSSLTGIYSTLTAQFFAICMSGALLFGIPIAIRRRDGLFSEKIPWNFLFLVCAIGYAYMGIEIGMIHRLVLFVGHPTAAISTVVGSMLLFSGIGSLSTRRFTDRGLNRARILIFPVITLVGFLLFFKWADLLVDFASGYSLWMRIVLCALFLAPLSFFMGMPFPLALRSLSKEHDDFIPWAWALNGWMSVLAGFSTVLLSRFYGYSTAIGSALAVYLVATLFLVRMNPGLSSKLEQ